MHYTLHFVFKLLGKWVSLKSCQVWRSLVHERNMHLPVWSGGRKLVYRFYLHPLPFKTKTNAQALAAWCYINFLNLKLSKLRLCDHHNKLCYLQWIHLPKTVCHIHHIPQAAEKSWLPGTSHPHMPMDAPPCLHSCHCWRGMAASPLSCCHQQSTVPACGVTSHPLWVSHTVSASWKMRNQTILGHMLIFKKIIVIHQCT